MQLRFLLLLGALLLGCGTARSDTPIPIHIGEHPGFGRIVFDFAESVNWNVSRQSDQVTITFETIQTIGPAPYLPRNVVAIKSGDGTAEITVVPGARIRTTRVQEHVVLDVLDPVRPSPHPEAAVRLAQPADRHQATALPAPVDAPAASPVLARNPDRVSPPIVTAAEVVAAPTIAPAADPPKPVPAQAAPPPAGPVTLMASPNPVSGTEGPSLLLPFDRTVGPTLGSRSAARRSGIRRCRRAASA
jgi:hypothetical protein